MVIVLLVRMVGLEGVQGVGEGCGCGIIIGGIRDIIRIWRSLRLLRRVDLGVISC